MISCSSARVALVMVSLSAGAAAFGAIIDMSPPLQEVQAEYTGFEMVCRVFDPAQGKVIENRTPAAAVFEAANRQGVVTWSSGNAFFLRLYDPARTNWMGLNIPAGSVQDIRSHRGTVAWNGGSTVVYHVYDPVSGTFLSESGPGSTFDLRSVDGVVSWTSGNGVFLRTFDPAGRQWQGLNVASSRTFDLVNTNGIVAWSSADVVRCRAYDPLRRQWTGDDAAVNSLLELRNDSGLVAWSNGSALWARLFNPATGMWLAYGETPPSRTVLGLAITNATLSWSDGFNIHQLGYNWYTTNWQASPTLALPFFAVSTNAGPAPLQVRFTDMSVGTIAQQWDFGDATALSPQRSPAHTYTNLGRFPVTLTVAGWGTNTIARTNVLTDFEPPSGQVVINGGATSTTNRNVTLTLGASDNSGAVPRMRLSNDAVTWAEWEPFVTNKAWQLPEGVATRTVFAQFEDPFGNQSAVASDSIFLDTTPPPRAQFRIAETNTLEQTRTLAFDVVLEYPMNRQIRLDYATRDGTATAGQDYVAASGSLVYLQGTTVQSVSVQIRDDTEVEVNEDFYVDLLNPTDVVPGEPLRITIQDNDAATVRFATDRLSAGEAAGAGTLNVLLSAASGLVVTVEYAATNGTAIAGLDFVPVTGRLTFMPGQISQGISVPLLDDGEDEYTETIQVSLSHATNAVLAPPATATIEILDNDPPTVNLTAPEYWVNERGGSVSIQAVLTKPYPEAIFVDYRTSGGTASPGQDYVVANGTLIFTPGQTNRSFDVTILQSPTVESDETIGVNLSSLVNVQPGKRLSAQILVLDGDRIGLVPQGFETSGGFRVQVVGPPGSRVLLQATEDLGVWSDLATLDNPTGTTGYVDAGAIGTEARYYRVRALP